MSRLELALSAGISARHVCFIETGRSAASRESIVQLSDALALTLRERNLLLLAAGFAPAIVMDRHYNIVDANTSSAMFTAACAPQLLETPI